MATFDYRRKLTPTETSRALMAGVGAGVAVGLAAAYLARILLQRTPVTPDTVVAAPGAERFPMGHRPRA